MHTKGPSEELQNQVRRGNPQQVQHLLQTKPSQTTLKNLPVVSKLPNQAL